MSKIKGIILDFDGIILESMDIKARAFAHLFRAYPADVIAKVVELHMAHGGLSRFEKFEMIYRDIVREELSARKKESLGKEFAEFAYQEVLRCRFVPGAREFLEAYHEKLKLFVVSGTPQAEIRSIVKERALDKYFVAVFGAPEKKDSINRRILKENDLTPEQIVSVGDSIDDYEGAVKTGIPFIGRIVDGKDPFKGLKTEAFIRDMAGLEKVLIEKRYV